MPKLWAGKKGGGELSTEKRITLIGGRDLWSGGKEKKEESTFLMGESAWKKACPAENCYWEEKGKKDGTTGTARGEDDKSREGKSCHEERGGGGGYRVSRGTKRRTAGEPSSEKKSVFGDKKKGKKKGKRPS